MSDHLQTLSQNSELWQRYKRRYFLAKRRWMEAGLVGAAVTHYTDAMFRNWELYEKAKGSRQNY